MVIVSVISEGVKVVYHRTKKIKRVQYPDAFTDLTLSQTPPFRTLSFSFIVRDTTSIFKTTVSGTNFHV